MLSKVYSCCFFGMDGYCVEIETFISNGLPSCQIVGLPDAAVNESKERVRSAIKNSGMEFPLKRITVNMAPADIRKEGAFYDLPLPLEYFCPRDRWNRHFRWRTPPLLANCPSGGR